MASWFDSFSQSIGNFVTGHGFEDNASRARLDAQNAKKKRDEEQAARVRQVVQRDNRQPQFNNSLSMPGVNKQPPALDTTLVQQPTQPAAKPKPQSTVNKPTVPPVTPSISKPSMQPIVRPANSLMPDIATTNPITKRPNIVQPTNKSVVQPRNNPVDNIIRFLSNTTKPAIDTIGNTVGLLDPTINSKERDRRFQSSIPGGIVNDAKQLFNSAAVPISGIVGAGMIGADKLFNGGKNAKALEQGTMQQMSDFQKNSFIPDNVMRGTATPLEFGQGILKTGARYAPYVIPGANAETPFLRSLATNTAIQGGTGFATDAINQIGSDKPFDWGQAVNSGITNAEVAAIMQGGTHLLGKGAKALSESNVMNGYSDGYIRIPGNKDVVDPKVARQNIINKLNEEANYFTAHEAELKNAIKIDNGSGNPVFNERKALFKEFRKNPEAFIDKYDLMPPEYKTVTAPKVNPIVSQKKVKPSVVEPSSAVIEPMTLDNNKSLHQQLVDGLNSASQQTFKDAASLDQARSKRAGKAAAMSAGLEGEAATKARRAGMAGEMGHRGQYVGIGGDSAETMFNAMRLEAQRNPEISKSIYTLDNVEEALSRAIRGKDLNGNVVGAPTKGQVELLRKHFGSDVADAVDGAVSSSKTLAQRVGGVAGDVVGVPRSIMASMDLSATVRQGGVLSSRFPKEAAQAAAAELKYFASPDAYNKAMREISDRPTFHLMEKSKLAITGVNEISAREEAFVSNLVDKIPGVAASGRAYTGFLTKLRADVFDKIINEYESKGRKLSDKELGDISKFINTASGRGDLGKFLEEHSKTLTTTLFSPRLWKSRLDMLNPVYYAKLSGPARKYALQSAASFATLATTVLGTAAAAGAQVETDPRSSDFLKIKVGDTRYDILGGFQQNIVFATREVMGEKKNSSTGEVTKFAKNPLDIITGKSDKQAGVKSGPYVPNRVTVATDLIQNKENPILAAGTRILSGKDRGGNDVNALKELGALFVPLTIAGTVDAANSIGSATNVGDLAKGALINSPDVIGVSAQTYAPSKPKNGSVKPVADKWYGITSGNEKSSKNDKIERTDGQAAVYTGDVKGLSTEDIDMLAMTSKEVMRDVKSNNYDSQIRYLTALKHAEDRDLATKDEKGSYYGGSYTTATAIAIAKINQAGGYDKKFQDLYAATSKAEWKDMAPDGDNPNPELYQKLAQYDAERAGVGGSLNSGDHNKRKYSTSSGGGGRSSSASGVPLTKAVTSGSGTSGGKFSHQDINVDIPQAVKPTPQYVIKQRKISVG